ncbi:hypothetical protein MG293_011644 [Ovis ammon polii]|uniref:STE20-related kinase adapter protein alpha n=1 Tax=Ovis ammon polii TaxID=230172 RepID=A0AAD4Y9E1_OVIAM|nr:hypothetical protein MG293_011644 [Ovis ammon polii]KAI4562443.1 hypothetical protein MJT46_011405 [Ovis ammon polii x Ovis aries]
MSFAGSRGEVTPEAGAARGPYFRPGRDVGRYPLFPPTKTANSVVFLRWHPLGLTSSGKGFEDLISVNLTKYKPMGEYVTVQRINLEACSSEMVTFLQQELHVSKFFSHANTLPYQAAFIADNELWLVTPFPAYGSAKDLIYTHFMDGMNELEIAYSLQGALRVHYTHHMGYVHRRVKTGQLHSDPTQQLSTICRWQ